MGNLINKVMVNTTIRDFQGSAFDHSAISPNEAFYMI